MATFVLDHEPNGIWKQSSRSRSFAWRPSGELAVVGCGATAWVGSSSDIASSSWSGAHARRRLRQRST